MLLKNIIEAGGNMNDTRKTKPVMLYNDNVLGAGRCSKECGFPVVKVKKGDGVITYCLNKLCKNHQRDDFCLTGY